MMGRIILVRFVLSSIPIYFVVNIVVLFFCLRWLEQLSGTSYGAQGEGCELHLVSWEVICQSVQEGDLGI